MVMERAAAQPVDPSGLLTRVDDGWRFHDDGASFSGARVADDPSGHGLCLLATSRFSPGDIVLRERATELVSAFTEERSASVRRRYFEAGLAQCAAAGLTAVQSNDGNA